MVKQQSTKGAYDIPLLKGNIIDVDRLYNHFSLLNVWDSNGVCFVVRYKNNIKFETIKELGLPKNKCQHLIKEEIIEFTGNETK